MEQRIPIQAWQFLWAVASGILPGMFYDFIRGLEQEVPRVTPIGDVLTGLILLLGNVLLLLYVGDGEYRLFFPVGTAAGYGLWKVTGSTLLRRGSRLLWGMILYVPRKIWRILKKFIKNMKIFLQTPFQMKKNRLK